MGRKPTKTSKAARTGDCGQYLEARQTLPAVADRLFVWVWTSHQWHRYVSFSPSIITCVFLFYVVRSIALLSSPPRPTCHVLGFFHWNDPSTPYPFWFVFKILNSSPFYLIHVTPEPRSSERRSVRIGVSRMEALYSSKIIGHVLPLKLVTWPVRAVLIWLMTK